MRKSYVVGLVGLAAFASVAGCQDDAPETPAIATVPEAFPQVLLPPGGRIIARSGSEDALQLVFRATPEPQDVADYYRRRLTESPWEIVSDTRAQDTTIIFAELRGRPLWVRVTPGDAGVGSRVELNGAVVDTQPSAPVAPAPAEPIDSTDMAVPEGGLRRDS